LKNIQARKNKEDINLSSL